VTPDDLASPLLADRPALSSEHALLTAVPHYGQRDGGASPQTHSASDVYTSPIPPPGTEAGTCHYPGLVSLHL